MLPALIRRFHEAARDGAEEVVIWGSGTPRREFLRDVLGVDTTFGPAAFTGNAAVLPWAIAGEAGRAFLREEVGGWSVILLSGESLRFAATFRVLGMSPRLAAELEASIAAIEADLDATQRAAHDAFAGTLLLVDG